jgi:hypothetical protein
MRAMKPDIIAASQTPELRELQDEEVRLVSGAGIHFSIFGVDVDITEDAYCVTVGKTQTCTWK